MPRHTAAFFLLPFALAGAAAGHTTNAMTSSAGCNTDGDCMQGMFLADALRSVVASGTSSAHTIAYINGQSIMSGTWAANTEITTDVVKSKLFKYEHNKLCTMKLRGASVISLLAKSVGSKSMAPGDGSTSFAILQISGARATFNTNLNAADRLVSAEVSDGTGGWSDIDRTALYTIASSDYDFTKKFPFSQVTGSPKLDGETALECELGSIIDAVVKYASVPVTIDIDIGSRNIAATTGSAMIIHFTAAECLKMSPPRIVDRDTDYCKKCSTGESTTDGTLCKAPAAGGPVTGPQTLNAMPSSKGAGGEELCLLGDCAQGYFLADAMRFHEGDAVGMIAITNGKSIGGPGWPKGAVGEPQYKGVISYTNKVCKQQLRGISVIQMFAKSVSSKKLKGVTSGENFDPLQVSGVRVKFNSALPAEERLVGVEVKDGGGNFQPIDRTAMYTVVGTDYDFKNKYPYKDIAKRGLAGESEAECGADTVQQVMAKYVEAKSPLSLDLTIGARVQPMTSGSPMVVKQTVDMCKAMTAPHWYDETMLSCMACAPGQISDGAKCSGGTVAVTGMATSNAMPSTEGKLCEKGDCGQGMLMSDALRASVTADVGYVNAGSLKGAGWAAGAVTEAEVKEMFPYATNKVCTMKARGATLLRLAHASVSTSSLPGATGSASTDLLQLSGMRVTYSTTLPAADRLVKVEVSKGDSWVDVDRTALYTVAATDYDFKSKYPYNKFTKEATLDGEEKYSCVTTTAQQAIMDFLKANSPWTVPAAGARIIGASSGAAIKVELTAGDCLEVSTSHYFDLKLAACLQCASGKESTGVGCVAAGGASLTVAAERLSVATTHAPLLSGGFDGCRKAEGGVIDLENPKCTSGLVEAVMNFRNLVAPAVPSAKTPMPMFIPTADYADELLSMHADRWGAQCAMFKRFKASAFQVTRVDLTHEQTTAGIPWDCSANLLLGNADFDPPTFWYKNAQKLLVDKDSGLGVTVVMNSTGARAQDVVSSIAVAAEMAEADADVKAFMVLVQNADPKAVALELEKQKIFATAVVATTKHMSPEQVGEIWVGGKSAISSSNMKRLAVHTLEGPFTPHIPQSGVAASLVKASGLKLTHHNPASAADRKADSQWTADQKFVQDMIDKAMANNPTLAHSQNPVPHTERNSPVSVCMKGDCMQGKLVADAVRQSIGGVGIALVGSSAIGGPGWPVGPIKVSNVYDMHKYPNFICTQKLRGETLMKIFGEMLLSQNIAGLADGTKKVDTFQLAGARVTYSTVLAATSRLLKAEVIDEETGNWVALDRTRLYPVGGADYDLLKKYPFIKMTKKPELAGETAPLCGDKIMQDIIGEYVKANDPFMVPVDVRLIATDGTEAIPVEESAALCLAMVPPKIYDPQFAACTLCPISHVPAGSGLACVPLGGGGHGGKGSSNTGGNGDNANGGGAAGGAGSAPATSNTGLIIGVVVGLVALVAVAVIAVVVVRRRQAAAGEPLLEARLDPTDELEMNPHQTAVPIDAPTLPESEPPMVKALAPLVGEEADEDL